MAWRLASRAVAALLVVAIGGAQLGCATRFVAKRNNPLKPVNTTGWDPGELSEATRSQLASVGFAQSWRANPAGAIAALEPSASRDVAARRAVIEVALAAGIRADAKFLTNRGAAGLYLCVAENAFDGAGQGDADFQHFCTVANRYAVSRIANLREIAADKGVALRPNIEGPTHSYQVALRTDVPGAMRFDQFKKLMPVDRYKVVGAREPAIVEGVGTPLVGKLRGPTAATAVREFKVVDDSWMPFTATVEFGPRAPTRRTVFTVYDRKSIETVPLGPKRETLAADFSTPFAVRVAELQKENFFTLGILGFLRGDRFFESTGLYPLEFPREDKIPVVFVHGLIAIRRIGASSTMCCSPTRRSGRSTNSGRSIIRPAWRSVVLDDPPPKSCGRSSANESRRLQCKDEPDGARGPQHGRTALAHADLAEHA
jgi:hypothetical protein